MSNVKEFNRGESVREISSSNYLALETMIDELKVNSLQCKIAYDYEAENGSNTQADEILYRGICNIQKQLADIKTWYDCITRGVDMDM